MDPKDIRENYLLMAALADPGVDRPRPADNAVGKYEPITIGGEDLWSFVIKDIPPKSDLWLDEEVFRLHSQAREALTVADDRCLGVSQAIAMNEALFSARIEGYAISAEAVMYASYWEDSDELLTPSEKKCATEVLSLVDTCASFDNIRDQHYAVFAWARSDPKTYAGKLREVPCWIGGRMPSMAIFVPPAPKHIKKLMARFDKMMAEHKHSHESLLLAGLSHGIIETIHPFFDGNGRIGRQLISSMLSALVRVHLPISMVFYEHRTEYYKALDSIRRDGNYFTWLKFFFRCIIEACDHAKHMGRILSDARRQVETAWPGGYGNTSTKYEVSYTLYSRGVYPMCRLDMASDREAVEKMLQNGVKHGFLQECTDRLGDTFWKHTKVLELIDGDKPWLSKQ